MLYSWHGNMLDYDIFWNWEKYNWVLFEKSFLISSYLIMISLQYFKVLGLVLIRHDTWHSASSHETSAWHLANWEWQFQYPVRQLHTLRPSQNGRHFVEGLIFFKLIFFVERCYILIEILLNLVGNKIVDHSDVVGASPVGAAPTTSSFST